MAGAPPKREVSNLSARAVYEHLDPEKYDVYPISVTADGKWQILPKGLGLPALGKEAGILGSGEGALASLPIPSNNSEKIPGAAS